MFSYDTATTVGRINPIAKRRLLGLRQELGVPSGVRLLPDGKLCLASGKKSTRREPSPSHRLRFRAELKAIVMTEMIRHKKARTPKKKLSTSYFVRQDMGHQAQGI